MKTTPQTISTLLVSLTFLLISCSKQEQKATDLVTFPLKGEVVAIDTAKHRLMVAHEEIPNYMDAMTMPFKIKNLALLKSVQVGDSIQGVLAVSRTERWLETFTVTGKGEPPMTADRGDNPRENVQGGSTLADGRDDESRWNIPLPVPASTRPTLKVSPRIPSPFRAEGTFSGQP